MQKFIVILLMFLCLKPAFAHAATYSNFINDGGWRVDTSPFECRMTHSVPFYGDAIFRKRAGEESAEFFLHTQAGRFAEGLARVTAEAPVWRPAAGSADLGEVAVDGGTRPIALEELYTERMFAELHQGREIVFRRDAWYGDGEARLAITSIAFRPAYRTYLNCLADLLPANFDQIKRTAVYFASGEAEELPAREIDKLEHILLYAQADRQLKEIYIDGHTDSIGTRENNLQLSEARARLVTDYLVKRGMPEERIIMRWHGERYPVQANDSAGKRAQNRRVTIRLERADPVTIPPLASSAGSS